MEKIKTKEYATEDYSQRDTDVPLKKNKKLSK